MSENVTKYNNVQDLIEKNIQVDNLSISKENIKQFNTMIEGAFDKFYMKKKTQHWDDAKIAKTFQELAKSVANGQKSQDIFGINQAFDELVLGLDRRKDKEKKDFLEDIAGKITILGFQIEEKNLQETLRLTEKRNACVDMFGTYMSLMVTEGEKDVLLGQKYDKNGGKGSRDFANMQQFCKYYFHQQADEVQLITDGEDPLAGLAKFAQMVKKVMVKWHIRHAKSNMLALQTLYSETPILELLNTFGTRISGANIQTYDTLINDYKNKCKALKQTEQKTTKTKQKKETKQTKKNNQSAKEVRNKQQKEQQTSIAQHPQYDVREDLPGNNRITTYALSLANKPDQLGAGSCTDWVDLVYHKVVGKSVYSMPKKYNGIVRINEGTHIGGTPATVDKCQCIKPGDHITIDHPLGSSRSNYGHGKTHSVIALSSPTKDGIIKTISYPGGRGKKPQIEYYNLSGHGSSTDGGVTPLSPQKQQHVPVYCYGMYGERGNKYKIKNCQVLRIQAAPQSKEQIT